ncbi:5601_t:CDS:2 [Ambispora gerdemannii]|uniref:5601_t:CDS:1 n=1 Tax=Ambispora gerdemannii TaxID=144530 RepID=A0A9N8VBA4_9GLOM|nr:5601_t:CDS:2 [Ambispora gerdemannii]
MAAGTEKSNNGINITSKLLNGRSQLRQLQQQHTLQNSSHKPLFELVNIPNRLVLDNVYLNGLHSLRSFEIRNISPNRILVKLRSNLGSQIAFQLTNENLPDFDTQKSSSTINNEFNGLPVSPRVNPAAPQPSDLDNYASSASEDFSGSDSQRLTLSSPSPPPHLLPPSTTINPLNNIATNTVAAAAAGAFGDIVNGHQFNQLFNHVNHIDEVEIRPGQTQKVILAFLPDARDKARRALNIDHNISSQLSESPNTSFSSAINDGDNVETTEDANENANLFLTTAEGDETHDFFEVNGLLFFFAYSLDKELEISADDGQDSRLTTANEEEVLMSTPTTENSFQVGSSSTSVTSSTIDQVSPSAINKPLKSEADASSGSIFKADYQVTIKFRSTVCRSVLWTDVGETGINFYDCVTGGTYFKDFTIWNRSEIELYWLINTVDLSNSKCEDSLKFTDYDTGELLDAKPIPSYTHRRIRVTFRPKEIGEFNYDLQLENANDPSNVLESRIHAVVRSVLREESLVVSSGNVLDFGDCCAGCWSKQQLVLKNVSESPLEIHFSAENAEILFHLNVEDSIMIDNNKHRIADAIVEGSLNYHRVKDVTSAVSVSIPNISTPTVNNTTNIIENSVPNSITSSRAASPLPLLREGDTLSSPTEIAGFQSQPLSQSTSRSTSRHRFNLHEDSDFEGPLTGNNSDVVFTPKGEVFKKGYLYLDNQEGVAQIDEVLLRPGRERTVQVSYRPEKDSSANDFNAGHLTRRSFRIILTYGPVNSKMGTFEINNRERKIIKCKARSCTSFVKVEPKEVNFGDTDVGTLKSMPIVIKNLSELTAHVELQFISKVLSCNRDEITIPPKQSIKVKLDMYPRKVNIDYRKQITMVNLQNRDNDKIIEVRSANIDKNRVTFHSLFYRILTANVSHYLNFGSTVLNSPRVRTFTIDNISKKNLVLELTSSLPDEIVMYQKQQNIDETARSNDVTPTKNGTAEGTAAMNEIPRSAQIERREKLLESIADRRSVKKHISVIEGTGGSISMNSNLSSSNLVGDTRSNTPNLPDFSTVDLSSTTTAYLDLASSSLKDIRRSPRKRPHKLPLGKTGHASGPAIERVKEAENIFGGVTSKSNQTSSFSVGSNSTLSNEAKEIQVNEGFKKQSTPRVGDVEQKNLSIPNAISTRHNKKEKSAAPIDFSRMSFESLIAALEVNNDTAPPLFPKPSMEELYVRNQMGIVRELRHRIKDQQLVPVKSIEIPPGTERQIMVVFTPNGRLKPLVQGLPRKQDARIFLRLIEFDRDIEQPQFESLIHGDLSQIPVRELLVRSTLCRSIMVLGQKNINFGVIDKNENRNKTIVIQNRSEVPLLYTIRKSGSIASGDIVFGDGRYGVIRGYGKKEVEFRFDPSLPGQFHEKLIIENIQDRENDQTVYVKANIRKQSTFSIQPTNINFGSWFIDKNSAHVQQHIVISNIDRQSRTFEVRVDPKELQYNHCNGEVKFSIQNDVEGGFQTSGLVSKEMEEEIENLEQKVKIAKRKGREDKVKKLEKKISRLQRGEVGREEEDEFEGKASSLLTKDEKLEKLSDGRKNSSEEATKRFSDPNATITKSSTRDASGKSLQSPPKRYGKEAPKYRTSSTSIIFPLEARTTKTISVFFRALSTSTSSSPAEFESAQEDVTGHIYVHEHKNTDDLKTIVFKALVCYDYSSYLQAQSREQDSSDTNTNERENQSLSRRLLDSFAPPPLNHLLDAISAIFPEKNSSTINELPSSIGIPRVVLPEQTIESIVDSLVLEPSILDIGRLEVNHEHNYYFKISNRADIDLEYEIIIPIHETSFFKFQQTCGILSPQQTKRIDFTTLANSVGRQAHSLIVRDMISKAKCTFILHGYVHYPQYLRFPALGDDGQSDLNLGYCYVDAGRKYSQVTPLLVENITDQDVYITCQSNLSLQVIIFLDERGERGQVVETLLRKGKTMTVWVALQPNLLRDMLGNARRVGHNLDLNNSTNSTMMPGSVVAEHNANLNAECRTLIGGIKFSVQVKEKGPSPLAKLIHNATELDSEQEELVTAIMQTVKFTSLIGRSVLSVSEKIINLSTTSTIGETFYGSFTLQNLSSHLPLNYLVESPSGSIILDRSRGTLGGWSRQRSKSITKINSTEVGTPLDTLSDEDTSQAIISFKVTSSKYGLFRQSIIVTNLNNTEQVFEVEVRLYVDPDTIGFMNKSTTTTKRRVNMKEGATDDILAESPKEIENLPSLIWDNIYVTITENGKNLTENFQLEEQERNLNLRAVIQKGYQAANSPLYEQCVEISNKSLTDTLQIVPKTNLDISVRWGPFGEPRIINRNDDSELPFQICGPVLELKPGEKAFFYVTCPQPSSLTNDQLHKISKGKEGSLQGVLLLYDLNTQATVKMIELTAYYCVSIGELSPAEINLGMIGHANSWANVKFQFTLRNISDIPLHYELQSPDSIEILGIMDEGGSEQPSQDIVSLKRTVNSQVDQVITAILKTRSIENFEAGKRDFQINILNMFNPNNEMILNIEATLTLFEVMFERLVNGELVLPTLYHPIPRLDLPCDTWFTILNSGDEDIRFEIGAELSPDVSPFLRVEILSRFLNSPLLGHVTVNAHNSIEIRVRAHPNESRRLPHGSSYLINPDGITFGKLWIATKQSNIEESESGQITKTIPIRGVITESSTFTISKNRIIFKTAVYISDNELNDTQENDENEHRASLSRKRRKPISEYSNSTSSPDEWQIHSDSVIIKNLCAQIPLSFKVTIEGPIEVSAHEIISVSPLDEQGCGVVDAGQQNTLNIELKDYSVPVSDDFKIHIDDLQSLSSQRYTILVSVESEARDHRTKGKKSRLKSEEAESTMVILPETIQKKPLAPSLEQEKPYQPSLPDLPFITLRGCKRIGEAVVVGGRYELDLGQQDLGSPTLVKKLTLENSSFEQLSYHIKTVFTNDQSWLKISRTEGTLEPSGGGQNRQYHIHTITLSFYTSIRSVYSTYLIVENLNNPSDTKTIRVMMEVVARQNLRRGASTPLENNHVFDIYVNGVDTNQTCIEMLNLFYGSEYSARSMVIYNRETVPLEFTFQTNIDGDDLSEIVFSTSRMSAKLFKTLTVDPESNVRVYIRFRPLPSTQIQAAIDRGEKRDPDEIEEKNIEIHVNCRLVKDYQQTVMLKAECRMPSLRVQYEESEALMGRIFRSESEEDWIVEFDQSYREIRLDNLLDIPLEYEIVNDTMYFTLEIPDSDKRLPQNSHHIVKVWPNCRALIKNAENVRREKYIQENVTVYNRNRPSENYWIPLRISFGHISNFQLASGYRSSYAFGMLENHTVCFLSDYNSNTYLFELLLTTDDKELKRKMVDLEFHYFYIVDQLVYYATIKTGENWFQLASLLFVTVLGSKIFQKYAPAYLKEPDIEDETRIWPPLLAKWVGTMLIL